MVKEEVESQIDFKLSQPYVLMLHNDDHNSFDHVISSLIKYCGHEYEQANQCANIVHFNGKCDVKRGDHDTVNDSYTKLKSNGLTVTVEIS
jgi:ATP-dependent Clp protease adaptor protein ClpS